MRLDPFTLVIAKDKEGSANGSLYLDDEETFNFEKGAYAHTLFNYQNDQLTCQSIHEDATSTIATDFAKSKASIRIERIHILGQDKAPSRVKVVQANGNFVEVPFDFDSQKQKVTIRDPSVSVSECGWSITVVY